MKRATMATLRRLVRNDVRVFNERQAPMAQDILDSDARQRAEIRRLRAQHAAPLTTRSIKPSDKRLLLCPECGGRCGARVSFCSHVGRVVAAVEFRRVRPAKATR